MQPATAPYILRALYKDDFILDSYVTRPLSDLVTATLGAHFTNRYDSLLGNISKGLYIFFALLRGQTLGEEFCDLLLTTSGATPRLLRFNHKALLALFLAIEPVALFHFAVRFFPSSPPDDVIAIVQKCILMFLFLFERYGTLSHRLLRARYLSLVPSRALHGGEGAPGTYFVPGLVTMVELAVRLWRALRARRAQSRGADAGGRRGPARATAAEKEEEDSDADEGGRAPGGRCMLCLGSRKHPTATLCGHIFCWRCLAEWINSNSQGAICPFCRRRITLQSSVPLFFYVAKEPPTVGGGSANPAPQIS